MSNLSVNTFRSDDNRIIKAILSLDYSEPYDYVTVSFKCNELKIGIISTSNGNIDAEGNLKLADRQCEMYLDYCKTSNKLDCLVGYMANNELKYYETLTGVFDNNIDISETHISLPNLKTIPGTYNERYEDFFAALSRRKSSWEIELSCPGDLLLKVTRKGKDSIAVSFGEDSKDILSSDFIFQLDPQVDSLNFPKEIIRERRSQYSIGCKLGIYEFVSPDFIGIKNVFHKFSISNTLSISNFAG